MAKKEEIATLKALQQEESKRVIEQLLEDEQLKTENATLQITILLGGVGVLLLLVVITILMVRSKQKTNKKLAKQNNEIEQQKTLIEKEKSKSDELLLNILPTETAQELKLNGVAQPRSFEHVTILFTDFVNFSQSCATLSAEELVSTIHHYYSFFDS